MDIFETKLLILNILVEDIIPGEFYDIIVMGYILSGGNRTA